MTHMPSARYMNHRRHGIALIWIAILGLVLIGLAGLAIDTAFMFVTGHQLQNAADSSALAGANMVTFDQGQAVTDAVNWAGYNKAAGATVQLDSAIDVVVGTYNRSSHTFTPTNSSPNAVKATARRTSDSPGGPVSLFFGSVFGVSTSEVAPRTAIAMNNPLGAGIIVLDPTANPSLLLKGTGSNPAKIDVSGGGAVVVDSNGANAVDQTGNSKPYIDADALYIVGNDTAVKNSGIFPSGNLTINAPVAPDPLAWLPEPPKGTTQNTNNATLQPGYYPNGISGDHTLAAGIYYIDKGISLKNSEHIDATGGCLIFLKTGGIDLKGSSTITVHAMTSGTYAGVAIYQARGNSSPVTLRGNTGETNTGTLYFPSAAVEIQGTPSSSGNQLICNTLMVQGDAQLNIDYDGRNLIKRHMSFLVQ